jgi:hypothetical protein
MKILAYCYGPTCTEKDIFCEKFIEENDDYELVSSSSIRLNLSKSALVENKIVEQMVMEETLNRCVKIFTKNKKRKNILLNGLFLNEASRLNLINLLEASVNFEFKKVAIAFLPGDAAETYENLKNKKEFNNLDFEYTRKQFINFKLASKKEEADLLIDNVENHDGQIQLSTTTWQEQELVTCNTFKKVSEFIKHINSF